MCARALSCVWLRRGILWILAYGGDIYWLDFTILPEIYICLCFFCSEITIWVIGLTVLNTCCFVVVFILQNGVTSPMPCPPHLQPGYGQVLAELIKPCDWDRCVICLRELQFKTISVEQFKWVYEYRIAIKRISELFRCLLGNSWILVDLRLVVNAWRYFFVQSAKFCDLTNG